MTTPTLKNFAAFMKEYIIVFQMGNVKYLVGTHFYSATVKEMPLDDGAIRYWTVLHDAPLIEKFGQHHDYYYKKDGTANFETGGKENIMDLHTPVIAAIEKIRRQMVSST